MNADQGRGTSEVQYEYDQVERGRAISEYSVILKFSIADAGPLWRIAAQRLQDLGLDAEDIEDTIGPIDDPAICDCLLTLTMPDAIDGCQLEEFEACQGSMTPVSAQSEILGEIVSHEREILSHMRESAVDTEIDWRTGLDVAALRVTGNLPGPDHGLALPN